MLRVIPDFEGYQITETGKVFSLKSKKYLSTKIDRYGYVCFSLSKDGKAYYRTAHRLVASAFLANPLNLSSVNHINENKLDNRIENLEWVSIKDNNAHGTRNERISQTKRKSPVVQILPSGLRRWFTGVKEAAQVTGFNRCQISRVCRGLSKTAGNYEWRYLNERN